MTMRIGGVFDGVDEITGRAVVAPDHVRLDPAERARIGAYLRAGTEVMSTTATDVDQVEPDRGEVVPMGFRTDGDWVWSDEVPYYVETYGLAPEPDLYRHIVERGYRTPVPDAGAVARAQRALDEPGPGAVPAERPELPDNGRSWAERIADILEFVQFDAHLDDAVVDKTAEAILHTRMLHEPPQRMAAAIGEALTGAVRLTSLVPVGFAESQVRDFLRRLATRLDAARPWPARPFHPIDARAWEPGEGPPPAPIALS